MEAKHQLAAIVFTDAVGSSQSMREDEDRTLALLREDLDLMRERCANHGGEVLKSIGDGLMMLFGSASQAVACALEIQQQLGVPDKGAMQHRIGIHLGDVFISEGDAHGDGVNVAARLEEIASPGSICMSKTVYDVAKSRMAVQPKFLGAKYLKGIDEGIEVFELRPDGKRRRSSWAKRLPGGAFLPAFGIGAVAIVAITAFITRPWEPKGPPFDDGKMPPRSEPPAQYVENSKIHADLLKAKQEADDFRRMAAEAKKAAVGMTLPVSPANERQTTATQPTPSKPPKPGDPMTAIESAKLAEVIEKTTEEALNAADVVVPSSASRHSTLKGYSEKATTYWGTRDFRGMVSWCKDQTWSKTSEGAVAVRHWSVMADFKDWYLHAMQTYTEAKPLVTAKEEETQLKTWTAPPDQIGYQFDSRPVRRVGFESLPLWVIGASFPTLMAETKSVKRIIYGFTAMQAEQRNQRQVDPEQ